MVERKSELEDVSLQEEEAQVVGKGNSSRRQTSKDIDGPPLPAVAVSKCAAQHLQKQLHSRKRLRQTVLKSAKAAVVGGIVLVLFMAAVGWPAGLVNSASTRNNVMSLLFLVGLLLVALEDVIGLNKSGVMLLLAATLWTMVTMSADPSKAGAHELHHELNRGLQDVGSVVLFLLPAMGVVESIDHFEGFHIVTIAIRKGMAGKKERLPPIICILTFLLSSVIDNLTSTIVAIKILHHVAADDGEWRKYLGGLAVIAANAGGAWSPIGDVTTTMLWIQGKITAPNTVLGLFLPSVVCGLFPLVGIYVASCRSSSRNASARHVSIDKECPSVGSHSSGEEEDMEWQTSGLEEEPLKPEPITSTQILSLAIGIVVILLVPVLKIVSGLPPYLGMLLALGLMWLISELLHFDTQSMDDHGHGAIPRGVAAALHKVDLTGLLFFTGVLLCVGALDSAGVLTMYATMLVNSVGHSPVALCTFLGISSAIVDNVPLVEASIDMFKDVPTDDRLWQLVALAAGTGGSMLSVGSIAGVTLMSMEGVGFLWYCKRITPWAFLGFIFGIGAYQLQYTLAGN